MGRFQQHIMIMKNIIMFNDSAVAKAYSQKPSKVIAPGIAPEIKKKTSVNRYLWNAIFFQI